MASRGAIPTSLIRFGDEFELDLRAYELRRSGELLKLERIPMELLLLLIAQRGQLVSRDEIVERVWGKDVFLDTDNSINAAIRKIRQVLKDDPEEPRFVQTLTGRGYRFIAPVEEVGPPAAEAPVAGGLIGKKISHYRILQVLGGGGMGVVYKAEDLKLGRRVALKFLPSELAGDPKALDRIQREARAASALDHLNICAIYELGEHDGQPFIVMQLLEGQTLREWIESGPASSEPSRLTEVVSFGTHIADGLDAAHRKGIIHRDIKPANIFITNRGEVKILDFGVAKFLEAESRESVPGNESREQTGTHPASPELGLTQTCDSLGTPSYLSPEQARREELDARTDLFSFGLVLYEMITGRKGFSGSTATEIQAAVLHKPIVPARQLQPGIPPELESITSRAVEKDRALRYQTAAEMRHDLQTVKAGIEEKQRSASGGHTAHTTLESFSIPADGDLTILGQGDQFTGVVREVGSQTKGEDALIVQSRSLSQVVVEKRVLDSKRVWTGVIVLIIISIGAVTAWLTLYRLAPIQKLAQRRLTANTPDLPVLSAAISPDGKYLGYSDQQGIHVQLLQSGEVQNVAWPAGTRPGQAFWDFDFWYPDSTRFVADLVVPGKPITAWSLSILGTQPQKLIEDIDAAFGISPDGSAIAFLRGHFAPSEIWLMGPNGETPHKILATAQKQYVDNIVWSPTGKRIAYIQVDDRVDKGEYSIESCDLNGTNMTTILSDDKLRNFTWIAPDRLIYSRNLQDYSSDFAADNLSELKVDAESGVPQGKPHQFTDWSGFEVSSLYATSDGKHLGLIRSTHHGSVFVGDLKNDGAQVLNPHRLTLDDHSNIPLAWTPDSRDVIFASRRTQALEIYRQKLDGSSPLQLVTAAPTMSFYNARVSPDGAWVIVQGKPQNSDSYGLYRVPIEGGAPQLLFPVERETTDYRCLNQQTNLCAYGRFATDRKTYIIQSFDPTSGKGKELLHIPIEPGANYHWGLSTDGLQIGILRDDWGANQIEFFSLHGGPTRTITVKGYANLQSFDWGADLKSVIVGTSGPGGSTLLRIGLDGGTQAIWQQPQPLRLWGIPSPDGKHITMFGNSADANVWMIEDF